MHTMHSLFYQDSRKLSTLSNKSIDLVVTSPPYPMIEMWDEQFKQIDPDISSHLQTNDFSSAFEAMHSILDDVWCELYRVMKNGAFACINIGDATRTINKRFRLFANHSRIQRKFFELGFDVLPLILWRKQTNAPNKFMGSGMLPTGAYVTLEHEYILIFRKGNKRVFATPEEKHNRMLSSIFWEERNNWFSDIWDFKGTRQQTNNKELRRRSAAFPFLLPFRLINMYSVFGDTVLDPFLGTGTTTLAAMASGRDSIGYEVDQGFSIPIKNRIIEEGNKLNNYNVDRVRNHFNFIQAYTQEKGPLKYTNKYFGFPVMTKQETELKLAFLKSIDEEVGNKEAGNEEAGNKEAGNEEAGNKDLGNEEAGNKEAGNKEAGNKEAGNKDLGNKEVICNFFKAAYFDDEYIKSINPMDLTEIQFAGQLQDS